MRSTSVVRLAASIPTARLLARSGRPVRHSISRLRSRAPAVELASAASALVRSGSVGGTDQDEWGALGDSNTAAGFVGGTLPALGAPSRDDCDRTTDACPSAVDREFVEFLPGKPVHLANVSRGNATIDNIAVAQQTPVNQVEDPAGGRPAVAPQTQRAKLGEQTDIVTVGADGSILPFGGTLLKCFELGLSGHSCREHHTNPPEGEESLEDKPTRVQGEHINMPALVHKAGPRAKVLTVGHPAVLPQKPVPATVLPSPSAARSPTPTPTGAATASSIH